MMDYFSDWRGRQFMAEVSGDVANRMERACMFAARKAQGLAPKRTGRLRAGVDILVEIYGKNNYIEGIVGVHKRVFWALFQELGTVHHAAHPFLRPAVFGSAREILRILGGS